MLNETWLSYAQAIEAGLATAKHWIDNGETMTRQEIGAKAASQCSDWGSVGIGSIGLLIHYTTNESMALLDQGIRLPYYLV